VEIVSKPRVGKAYDVRSISLSTLAVLAVLYTLHFAQAVLLPFAVALLLNLLFAPLVRRLNRVGIPATVSAGAVVLLLVSTLLLGGALLLEPAKEWLRHAPTSVRQLALEFEQVKHPLEGINELSEEVGEMADLDGRKPKPQAVEINTPSALDRVMKAAPSVFASLVVTFLYTFFLLAGNNELSRRLLSFGKSWEAKRRLIRISREIHGEISRHLRTVTLINIGLGVSVGLVLWSLEIPNPSLWGTMVAILNFAPYVGALVGATVLAVVGAITFANLVDALIAPGIFLALTSLEGLLITPLILGRRLTLSPLMVFLSVIVWGWLWGVVGALIAVPLMSALKVTLAHSRNTRPLANIMES